MNIIRIKKSKYIDPTSDFGFKKLFGDEIAFF